jgi:Transmembrane family 220, helix
LAKYPGTAGTKTNNYCFRGKCTVHPGKCDWFMKNIYWIPAFFFALFAAVQYNDPDPLRWMLLYSAVTALFVGAALRQSFVRPMAWVVLAVAVLWLLPYIPDFWAWLSAGMPSIVETMKAEKPWVELVREFLGLLLSALACGWLVWKAAA